MLWMSAEHYQRHGLGPKSVFYCKLLPTLTRYCVGILYDNHGARASQGSPYFVRPRNCSQEQKSHFIYVCIYVYTLHLNAKIFGLVVEMPVTVICHRLGRNLELSDPNLAKRNYSTNTGAWGFAIVYSSSHK